MKQIAVIPGDGIGHEIMPQALRVLDILIANGLDVRYQIHQAGATAYHMGGHPWPKETEQVALTADAVLFGCIGDASLDHLGALRPDMAIGKIRRGMGLTAGLRNVVIPQGLVSLSPCKGEVVSGTDIMIVREMSGDVYFGQPRGQRQSVDGPFVGDDEGFDTMRYAAGEVRRIATIAFEIAQKRSGRIVSADKANVLETSRLWRKTVAEVAENYPDVQLEHMYADNVAMRLVTAPAQFDVILTGNLFGDILSDVASVLTGSVGLPGSALFADNGRALYEPGHGSALDISGKDQANPVAMIRCVALMLKYSLDAPKFAEKIELSIAQVLGAGFRTAEIYRDEGQLVSTSKLGDAVVHALKDML